MSALPDFLRQTDLTDPGRYAVALDRLPGDVGTIIDAVQQMFVHTDSLPLYGLNPEDFADRSRTTLPLRQRFDRLLPAPEPSLPEHRAIADREIGTCRDYAVATCGILRRKGVPSRVRCGFATYFTPGAYEDHWICEYRPAGSDRWRRADAQLDEQHRRHLGIEFDPADMPDGVFLAANQAWRKIRGGMPASLFGHGDATGDWFVWVNLARDCLSRSGVETSDWDTWRDAIGMKETLSAEEQMQCDSLADAIDLLESGAPAPPIPPPFWF